MKNIGKILWGLLFILIGIQIGANILGYKFNIFFPGWWTLFIILPSFIGLFEAEKTNKFWNILGLIIGICLLLASWNVLDFGLIVRLCVPLIFIILGLSIIFNNTIKDSMSKKVLEKNKEGLETIAATFASQKINKTNEKFQGADLEAIFGGVELDLRHAKIEEDVVIKMSAIFGGIDLYLPQDVNVKINSTPIFGGVSNKIINQKENTKTIYIEAFCMFGGVEIK